MNLKAFQSEDFCSGVVFALFGGATVIIARAYPLGTATRMEAGFVPTLLGIVLVAIGLLLMVRSISANGVAVSRFAWRPLTMITLAVVIFGVGIDRVGLVAVTLMSVIVARFAMPGSNFRETLMIAGGLAALVVVVFAYALNIPLKVWPL